MELFSLMAKLTLDAREYEKELADAQREADNFESPDDQTLDLDASGFTTEIAEAEASGTGFEKVMDEVFGKIKKALTVSGIVGMIGSIVSNLKEAIDMTAQTADGIDKGSDRLSISRKKYQEWDHALRQSGSSITDLQKGVLQFNNYLASFAPGAVVKDAQEAAEGAGGDMAQAFARLKINVKDANGNLKTTEQLLEESLIALAGFKENGGSDAERGALVTQLFGKGGTGLNNLLDQGVDGVKELLEEADKLGLIMSDEEIDNAVAYGDAVANLNAELQAVEQAFIATIIPTLKDAVTWLTEFLQKLNPRFNTNSIFDIFNDIDVKTVKASKDIDSATVTAKQLIEDLQSMGDYWTLDEEGQMTWDALAEKALELFPQLSEYIDKDGKKIQGNTEDIEANIDAWARLEKQRLLASAMDQKSEAIAKQLVDAYSKGADAKVKDAEAEGKRLQAIENINKLLEKQGKATLDENAKYEDIIRARDELLKKAGNNVNAEMYVRNSVSGYTDLYEQAEKMHDESAQMIKDAEDANANLKAYEAQLAETMGLTQKEVIKTEGEVKDLNDEINKTPTDVYTTFHMVPDYDEDFAGNPFRPRAIGDNYIPFDNFPALLHRGERVLTATEARRESQGTLDFGALRVEIAGAIREGMAEAKVTAIVTDRQVAQGANRYNGKEIDAGRYRP